jgi:hypothetical protein
MRSPEERLTLVTDFNALKAGDLVLIKNCDWCRINHRGLLTGPSVETSADPGGKETTDLGFGVIPEARCGELHITRFVVDQRCVYVIDTGLSGSETTDTAKPRRLERVR